MNDSSDVIHDQFPAIVPSATTMLSIVMPDMTLVPALIAGAGDQASWRYIDFFTANIRNPNTRRAYTWAFGQFFVWCEDRGVTLATIRPFDIST